MKKNLKLSLVLFGSILLMYATTRIFNSRIEVKRARNILSTTTDESLVVRSIELLVKNRVPLNNYATVKFTTNSPSTYAPFLQRYDFSGSNLQGMSMEMDSLDGLDLSYSNLSYSNLRISSLRKANLRHANLRSSYLAGADIAESDLYSSQLKFADLTRANLQKSDLSRANLYGSTLSNANLSRTNLSQATLRSANLQYVSLDHSILLGADLDGSKGLSNSDFSKSTSSPLVCNTRLPKGISIDRNRDCDLVADALVDFYKSNGLREDFSLDEAKQLVQELSQIEF